MYFGRNGDKMRKKGKRVKAMKRLCAFLLAAVLAVCGVTAACATSAAEPEPDPFDDIFRIFNKK